jgi:hypothetical protein
MTPNFTPPGLELTFNSKLIYPAWMSDRHLKILRGPKPKSNSSPFHQPPPSNLLLGRLLLSVDGHSADTHPGASHIRIKGKAVAVSDTTTH